MDATWRGLALADASGALTPEGARLLEQELSEERLAVITLLGPPSTRAARRELVAKLLGREHPSGASDDALVLLASVAYADEDEDFQVLVLDANASESEASSSGLQQLSGALCALSSLVVSCYDEIGGSTQCLAPSLPQFQSLFQTLVRSSPVWRCTRCCPRC